MQQMLRLIELEKSVVEGGGAVGVAALLQEGLLPELRVRSYHTMFVDVLPKGDVVELVAVVCVCECVGSFCKPRHLACCTLSLAPASWLSVCAPQPLLR